jgi:hypothetical protein
MSELWDISQPVWTLAEDIIRICYQETTSEDKWEIFACAVVIYEVYRSLIAL